MKKQVAYLQKLFYDLWNDFGSVYLLLNHSDRTRIGNRGFTEEEKKNGLVLVFNNRTNDTLSWDDEGNLSCVLAFGPRKEEILIHHDDLRGVVSPEAGVQYLRSDVGTELPKTTKPEPAKAPEDVPEAKKHIVSLSRFKEQKKSE